MILVYRQGIGQVDSKFAYTHKKNDSSAEAVKHAIKEGKLQPGDLATTVHVVDTHLQVSLAKTVRHWGVFVRHNEIEAYPDTCGIVTPPTSYKYHREYMKRGRIKSRWFALLKKRE